MTSQIPHESLAFLTNAKSFVVFVRLWWDGDGIDSVVVWMDAAGCHEMVLMTGEVRHKVKPSVVSETDISEQRFKAIVSEFVSLEVDRITTQNERLILSHYDDYYGIQRDASCNPHWAKVAGGKHKELAAENVLERVYEYCPRIFEQN